MKASRTVDSVLLLSPVCHRIETVETDENECGKSNKPRVVLRFRFFLNGSLIVVAQIVLD